MDSIPLMLVGGLIWLVRPRYSIENNLIRVEVSARDVDVISRYMPGVAVRCGEIVAKPPQPFRLSLATGVKTDKKLSIESVELEVLVIISAQTDWNELNRPVFESDPPPFLAIVFEVIHDISN